MLTQDIKQLRSTVGDAQVHLCKAAALVRGESDAHTAISAAKSALRDALCQLDHLEKTKYVPIPNALTVQSANVVSVMS